MRKIKHSIFILLSILLLTSCEKKDELKNGQEQISQECEQSAFVNGTYKIAISPEGYYKLNGFSKQYLSFIDKRSQNETYLCSKPECTHMDNIGYEPINTCNAYIGSVLPGSIAYHNEYVYVLEYDEITYQVYLVKISKDGSIHEKIMEVGTSPEQASYYSYVFGENSEIYMVYNAPDYTGEERSVSLEKINLNTREKTTVYTYTGKGACIAYLKVWDGSVYFTQVDKIDNRYIYHLMKYNMDDNLVEQVLDESINSYTLTENGKLIYFIFGDGIYICDLQTMEIKQIQKCNEEVMYVSLMYNGTYLVVDNLLNQYYYNEDSEHKLFVYDLEGKLINTISATGVYVELSDKNYIFAESWGEEGEIWKYIQFEDIMKKDVIWKTIEDK